MTAFELTNLTCEYRTNPLGIDIVRPRLSWQISSTRRGARQTAYQVVAALTEEALHQNDSLLWDTGKVISDRSVHIPYDGLPLRSRQRIHWRARIWDETDQPTGWSDTAWFEMGLLHHGEWRAQWVGAPHGTDAHTPAPSPFFRKEFEVRVGISSARLYITSLGIYEAYLNGQRVGEDVFAPGWTDYNRRVQYRVYDVASLLTNGPNAMGAILGDGWYCGHVAWYGRQVYGDRPKLLAQLEITLADGSVQTVVTDSTWKMATGPILEADLIMGETYDARREIPGWCDAGFDPSGWALVEVYPHPKDMALVAANGPSVRAQDELQPIGKPVLVKHGLDFQWIFDFGQNLVGRVRIRARGESGSTIRLQFGEMLDEHGKLYTANLRTARQTDTYILRGSQEGEIYVPHFTFHGFRYVAVSSSRGNVSIDSLTAIILHSDNQPASEFECSEPLLNQLIKNIRWGWRGNSVDIPSDCPQRDERLGWTGDAQIFAQTATYLTNAAGFFTKWVQDLADAQLPNGAIPSVAPATPVLGEYDGGPAWSDAFIIIPWTIYQQYGDTRILETHFAAMNRYMDYLVAHSPGLIRLLPDKKELGAVDDDLRIGGYGDWLAQDGSTDRFGLTRKDLLGTAFLAYDAKLMARIAAALGKSADVEKYKRLFDDVCTAFNERFLDTGGLVGGQTQTACVLALHFDLVAERFRPGVVAALINDIKARETHMSTGFVGTPYICQALTDIGRVDLAYALLLQQTFPSWLFSVVNGATTIWERWDSWSPEKGFQDPRMNSFNHYAYGAVGAWMYANIAGVRTDPDKPGFRGIILQPRPGGGLSYARAIFQSPYGLVLSHWTKEDGSFIWDVTIPPNATATAYIPAWPDSRILEAGAPAGGSPGVMFLRRTSDAEVYELASGSYRFEVVNGNL